MAEQLGVMQSASSYTSPSMQQAPQQQYMYAAEAYRPSPPQQPPMSLPPIQHFDGQSMQSQPQYGPAHVNGAQMHQHPPPYNPIRYQYHDGAMQPAPMPSHASVNGQNGMMRFPIPPQAGVARDMAGRSSSKKEIKRRTKTGCLTCRKRRIKCDEVHPACRNCQKSKRECLGYDPIFKQQPGPAPIQPAPASSDIPHSHPIAPVANHSSTPLHTFSPSATGGAFVPLSNPTQGVDGTFEYGTSLDPALASANNYAARMHPARKVRHVTIDQLFALNEVPPRFQMRDQPPPNSIPSMRDVEDFYRLHYAQGLDRLFETPWYSQRGWHHLQQDPPLLDFVSQCAEQMKGRSDDAASVHALQSLEARLVWQLALMPRFAYRAGKFSDQITLDALPRIETVERLLTGQYVSQTQVPPPPAAEHQNDHAKYNERNFWHSLGKLASIRDDNSDPNSTHQINDCLSVMRGILGMMENRDVLYSLAVARHIGGRMPDFHPQRPIVAVTNDANDDVNKFKVAHQFVESEDQRGTTQVIQRVCGMAMRGWVLQKQ